MQKNSIELAGFLGAKPTVRFLPSGTKVANARLAESYRFTDGQQKEQEHTNWHVVVCYGRLADIAEQWEKGDNVLVDGSLQIREFTPADGTKRRVYEVIARTVAKLAKNGVPDAELKDNKPGEQVPPTVAEVESDELGDAWPV
jgi:single-strand DNA-binding protein